MTDFAMPEVASTTERLMTPVYQSARVSFASSSRKVGIVQARLTIFEPNQKLLGYLERALAEEYDLQLYEQAEVLLHALQYESHTGIQPEVQAVSKPMPRPDLVVFAWEDSSRSLTLLKALRVKYQQVPIIVLSCSAELRDYEAFSAAAVNSVVLKPFSAGIVKLEINRCLLQAGTAKLVAAQETALDQGLAFVRSNKRMIELERQATLVARSDIPVLILGESGTGKEVMALFTHKMSRRRDRMFLKINCAAMPAELLESELFGYEQGAFTGALKSKPGKFELCDGGTIFLDEIGEMPAILQAKLLQVLQDGTFSRLGSRAPMRSDVRIVAATNINMKEAMQSKLFREDLYYRLNGLPLHLPPLRERLDEVPALAAYFMRKGAEKYGLIQFPLSPTLLRALCTHHWPGNLRELENLINRLLILRDEQAILWDIEHSLVPNQITAANQPEATSAKGDERSLKSVVRGVKQDAEAIAIARILEQTGWNRKMAASTLGISYKALLYKIKQYRLNPDHENVA